MKTIIQNSQNPFVANDKNDNRSFYMSANNLFFGCDIKGLYMNKKKFFSTNIYFFVINSSEKIAVSKELEVL